MSITSENHVTTLSFNCMRAPRNYLSFWRHGTSDSAEELVGAIIGHLVNLLLLVAPRLWSSTAAVSTPHLQKRCFQVQRARADTCANAMSRTPTSGSHCQSIKARLELDIHPSLNQSQHSPSYLISLSQWSSPSAQFSRLSCSLPRQQPTSPSPTPRELL